MLATTVGQLLINKALPEDMRDYGRVLDKKGIAKLFQELAEKYPERYREISKKLMDISRESVYTTGGFSFGLEHLRKARAAKAFSQRTQIELDRILSDPSLSDDQKEKAILDFLGKEGKNVSEEIYKESLEEGNPLALQVKSGTRGNAINLRSLRGGDLTYVDHHERPIPIPVIKSYSEGLSPAEYFAGAFGARKGTISTKFATQDAGFFCGAKSLLVKQLDGTDKQLGDLRIGDAIIGSDMFGNTKISKVTATFDTGVKDVYRYKFRVGKSRKNFITIDATEDHKILATMKRGAEGTRHGNKNSIFENTKLPLSRASHGFTASSILSFDDTYGIDESRAGILGALLGDGCMSTSSISFCCADPVLLEYMQNELSRFGWYLRWRGERHKYEYVVLDSMRAANYNRTNTLRTWLKELGLLGKKANTKTIPACAYTWNNESIAKLIGGLFETDGCVASVKGSSSPVITISSVSRRLIEQLRDLLSFRFGIHTPTITERKAPEARYSKAIGYAPKGNYKVYTIVINNYYSVVRFHERIPLPGCKANKLAELVSKMTKPKRAADFCYSFVGKEYLGKLPTCDIEVDHPDHLFVLASGIITSNSKQLNQAVHRLMVSAIDADEEPGPDDIRGLSVPTTDSDSEGALLAAPIGEYKRNTVITPKMLNDLRNKGIENILVRSPMVGGPADGGIYARDAGVREKGMLAPVGDMVGLAASQAAAEPISQGQLCLAKGTKVRMAHAYVKSIQDICIGDEVLGADRQGNLFPVKVTNVYDNGKRGCICSVFDGPYGELAVTSTAEHKVLAAIVKDAGDIFGRREYGIYPLNTPCHKYYGAVLGSDSHPSYSLLHHSSPVGERHTYDIEVDHPDHLFVLANGLIVSNSSKHSGGVAGAGKATSGFKLLDQLVQVPKTFPGGAAHAQVDGTVGNITEAPAGGYYLTIGNERHYVPAGLPLKVKAGDHVESGDILSEGIPNPAEIVRLKGIGEGRKYFSDIFLKAMRESGMSAHRRNIELLARGLINHIRLTEEYEDYSPGDVMPYNTLESVYKPRPGHEIVDPRRAVGKYLEKPVLHYSIGTKIQPSMLKNFSTYGINNLTVHNDPAPFEPEMVRGMQNLSHDPDWMTRLLGSNQQRSLLSAVHSGGISDEQGTSFVAPLARSVDFGINTKIKDWHKDLP